MQLTVRHHQCYFIDLACSSRDARRVQPASLCLWGLDSHLDSFFSPFSPRVKNPCNCRSSRLAAVRGPGFTHGLQRGGATPSGLSPDTVTRWMKRSPSKSFSTKCWVRRFSRLPHQNIHAGYQRKIPVMRHKGGGACVQRGGYLNRVGQL